MRQPLLQALRQPLLQALRQPLLQALLQTPFHPTRYDFHHTLPFLGAELLQLRPELLFFLYCKPQVRIHKAGDQFPPGGIELQAGEHAQTGQLDPGPLLPPPAHVRHQGR
jgi:hypothetical protein